VRCPGVGACAYATHASATTILTSDVVARMVRGPS
jgi:hypothetical protein